MSNDKRQLRDRYRMFQTITTRWMDNDVYGHVNNVTYYSYFDTAVNAYLIEHGGLDIHAGTTVGLVVSSGADYHEAIAFPDRIEAGLRVDKLGTSSVHYGVGIFRKEAERSSADGRFVHVFVDRKSNRPVSIPVTIRSALEQLIL